MMLMRQGRGSLLIEGINEVRLVLRGAANPVQRFRYLWYTIAFAIVSIEFVIGAGYLVGGNRASSSSALALIEDVEVNLHVHGAVMVVLAGALLYGLSDYRRVTRYALLALMFYSLWTALLIFLSFAVRSVSWGAPWWYLFVAVLSAALAILTPPKARSSRRTAAAEPDLVDLGGGRVESGGA